ncbi:MAG: hypothetical protein VX278_23495 [Myxococcota bacterium]|nr:hypothetical protein [Myxococcota bacterium]
MIWMLACVWVPEETPEERLAQASQKVIFASVEKLGSHRYTAQVRRREYRGDELVSEHEERVQIDWIDWDNFSYMREVDDREVMNLVVIDHQTWQLKKNGVWEQRPDAEPYRVQMRSSWNTWDQFVGPFEKALVWKDLGESEQDGRKVQLYEVDVDPLKISQKRNLIPKSISGSVSIDQATAVRVYAEVQLSSTHDDYTKDVRLQLRREDIGGDIKLQSPAEKK